MSNIKIIDGSFKKQGASYISKSIFTPDYAFLVDAGNGEKRIYNMRAALSSLETIIDDKKNPTIKMVLKDGATIIAQMKRNVFEELLIAKALAMPGADYLYSKPSKLVDNKQTLSQKEIGKKKANTGKKVLLTVFIVWIFYAVISNDEPSAYTSSPSAESAPASIAQTTNNQIDYMTQVSIAHEGVRLFDIKNQITDEDSVWMALRMFDQNAALYFDHKNQNLTKAELNTIAKFKRDLSALQQKAYPHIRQVYAAVLHERLWKNNVEVKAIGAGARIISFVGYHFADNGNIASTQEGLNEQIAHARYSGSRYQPFENAKGTQYKINVPSDGDIVVWNGTGYDKK